VIIYEDNPKIQNGRIYLKYHPKYNTISLYINDKFQNKNSYIFMGNVIYGCEYNIISNGKWGDVKIIYDI